MKKLTIVLGILLLNVLSATDTSNLPSPYNELEEILPFDPQGFYRNSSKIEHLIKKYSVITIVEVGSWLGASTRHMASCLPSEGKVYAVDHWLGSVEHQPGEWAWHSALPYLYQQFLSNVIHAELTNKIVPIRMSSLEAAKSLDVIPDLIYIDAAHDTESVYADLNAWYPFVKGHGILCGDDWSWRTVRNAVKKFASENNLRIKASGNFWRLKE